MKLQNVIGFCAQTFCLCVFLVSSALAENYVVPDGLGGYKVYQQFGTGQDWNTSNSSATSATNPVFGGGGGNLIRIDSAAENAFATTMTFGGSPWIGANDIATEGTWVWTFGSPAQFWQGLDTVNGGTPQNGLYNNWNGGEPNNAGDEDAATTNGSGVWNDLTTGSSQASLREFSAVSSLIDATTVGQTLVLNPKTGDYYQRHSSTTSWIDGKAIAEGRQLNGVQGYLVQVNNAIENGLVAGMGGGWIGLTDEAIFNGGPGLNFENAVWSSAYNSTFTPGSTTLASTVYTNWGGGEPNGNNGENYGEVTGGGAWNDLANGNVRLPNIEYHGAVPTNFTVRDIKSTTALTFGSSSIDTGIQMQNNLIAGASETTGQYAAINFLDPQNAGGSNVGNNVPFPNDSGGDDENFVVRARGAVRIPTTGNYQFRFLTDDNTQLVVADQVYQDNGCCATQTTPAYTLSAGVHNVTALMTEIGGGASFELLAETAPGSGVFQLIGDSANGGLATAARKEIYVRKEGFTTRDVKSGGALNNLTDAITLLSGSGVSESTTSGLTTVNFEDPQNPNGGERFGLDNAFPNNSGGDDDDFATDTTARLFVPDGSVGTWTLGVFSDDGFRLLIDNAMLIEETGAAATEKYGSLNLTAGEHLLRLIQFERAGGASLELFYAEGTHTSFNTSFELLTIPEPGSFALAVTGVATAMAFRRRRA